MRIEIEISDGINPVTALQCVEQVVNAGKISKGKNGMPYYCWGTSFLTHEGPIMVHTRNYRKNNCFLVYLDKHHENKH